MPASLQILTLIAGAYLLTYWLCTMLDYAEQLPE